MSKASLEKWGLIILRIALGAIFFYAGISKMRQPPWVFEASIASFQLVPDTWVSLLASSLPFFEALAGFWLIIGWRMRTAAFALVILNLVFVMVLGQAAVRGLDVNCDCFGARSSAPTPLWIAFTRDLLLLAASGFFFLK